MSDPVTRLTVTTTDQGVAVAGELDAHTCDELASALDPLPGTGDVVLDVSGIEFMDSSGLRALIGAHQRAVAEDRRLLIVRPGKAVERIIEISGLTEHLNIVTDSA